ncbi:hypothetical protein [Neisseria subflava]|uniref:hypothetical protein n=1 Tax=Neisseria subflava TaxID=28449 RepID=UPI00166161C0|nr:hypothetical protein [Neisseria sp. KH1003-01]
MAKVKNEDEKTEQTVGATVDVNPEDVKLQAFLEAEVEKLNAELEAARVRIAELEAQLEQTASPAVEAAEAQERYQAGGEAAADAEVVAIKSKHGHAFWRSGYHVQPHFTFVKRADFEPEAWERLLAEPMAVVCEALPVEQD